MIMQDGGTAVKLSQPPVSSSAASLRLDTYPAMEDLNRQYAPPVGQRVALLVHMNGNIMRRLSHAGSSGSGVALSPSNNSPTPTAAVENGAVGGGGATTEGSVSTEGDPFSFLSQDPASASVAPPPTTTKTTNSGFRGFLSKASKVAQSTTQRLERGMTQLAIKAAESTSNKNVERKVVVALVDITNTQQQYLIGLTEWRTVPSSDTLELSHNLEGIWMSVPLYVPGAAPPTARLQCQVYTKPATGNALWNAKPVLVGTTAPWLVADLRQAAARGNKPPPTQYHLPLQSANIVDGHLTVTAVPDLKLPALCGPGWSLADPTSTSYAAAGATHPPFDYPLDQSYATALTVPRSTPITSLEGATISTSTTTTPTPPANTSCLLATERTTESAVVLPLAAAWWNTLVKPAVQVSFAHAQALTTQVQYNRHDSPGPGSAATTTQGAPAAATAFANVETHVTMHQLEWNGPPSNNTVFATSVHCQRPDSIFEVEWGGGPVGVVSTTSTLPPPATVLAYPKPVPLTHVLPALQQSQQGPPPPHGYRIGVLRFQIMQGGGGGGVNSNEMLEAFLDLDIVLARQQSGQVLRLPVVPVDQPTNVVGQLHVTIRLTPPATGAAAAPTPVSPGQGLVALVGLSTQSPPVQPCFDALPPTATDEATARRMSQLATMGYFYSKDYMEFHMQQIRPTDSNQLDEKAKAYAAAVMSATSSAGGTAEPRVPAHQDRSPRAFRPSSSRSEVLLSGIPFNCHTATLQVALITAQEKRDVAYFYNITCGAPADHARDFGNIFRKELDRLGLVSPVGPVSGGLRRLEAKRMELMKAVDDLQTMLIMQVANYFMTERGKRKVVNHVPTRDLELQNLRWKLFEAVQSLHHTTWACAVRRASVFSQALGLAVTCFLASLSDAAKYKSSWPELWANHGFLVCFEGLLSAAGKELGMIEDASVGIDMLKQVQIVLVSDDGTNSSTNGRFPVPLSPYLKWVQISTANQTTDDPTEYLVHLGVVSSYYDQRVPANFKNGAKIRLFPLLFEVGVDIRQWGAHAASNASRNYRRGDSSEELKDAAAATSAPAPQGLLDDEDDDVGVTDDDVLVQLNFEAFQKLNVYAHRVSPAASPTSASRTHPLLETLHQHIVSSSGKINHDILDEAATLSQQLGGGAVVFCKSGKDRTAMHVTYKQAQFTNRYKRHWSPDATPEAVLEACLDDASVIRTHGTRLPICEKNVGQAKFAFNSLQVKFMPEKLKPPMSTLAGFLKGGKVFSGGGIES